MSPTLGPPLHNLSVAELSALLLNHQNALMVLDRDDPTNGHRIADINKSISAIAQAIEQKRAAHGLSPVGRTRSSTLDSLSIHLIELKHSLAQAPRQARVESPTWLLSDILQSFLTKDDYVVVQKGNDLVLLLSQYPNLRKDLLLKHLILKIQFMFHHQNSHIRAMGLRIVRHAISDYESLTTLVQSRILIFVIISLSTKTTLLEREEAVKLIRHFLTVPQGADNLSIGVVKCLIALIDFVKEEATTDQHDVYPAEDEDDLLDEVDYDTHDVPEPFKKVCVETLCEIGLLKSELLFHSGGFLVLINVIINGRHELSLNCLTTVIKLLDMPSTRKFLRNGLDMNSLVSVYSLFEDQTPDDDTKEHKKRTALNKKLISKALKTSFLLTIFLKSWTGLICFSHDNFAVLFDLVSNLKKRNSRLRNMIMDIIFDVLRIRTLPWLSDSAVGETITKLNSAYSNTTYTFEYAPLAPHTVEYHAVNHYVGTLLKVLLGKPKLLSRLLMVIEENLYEDNTTKATLLVSHVRQMANDLIPINLIRKQLYLETDKAFLLSSVSMLESAIRRRDPAPVLPAAKQDSLKSYIKNINIQAKINIDDVAFKNMITNTRVLTVKEFENWNWPLLSTLIQGPLRNPRRFDELVEKNPKFLKRLMSFYRPFKLRFCNVPLAPKTQTNTKRYIQIGCQLLETLMTFDSGAKYLASNKYFPQLSEVFAQVDPFSGVVAKDPILSKKRLELTLLVGYVRFLGVLSQNSNGLKILEQWQLFTTLSNIVEATAYGESLNYLVMSLFEELDFTSDSPCRLLLTKALSIGNETLKAFVIDKVLEVLLETKGCEFFALRNLVELLYDPNDANVKRCIDILSQHFVARGNTHNLEYFIGLRPLIHILMSQENGEILLMNACKIPAGFNYLYQSGTIERLFSKAMHQLQNFQYLKKLEASVHLRFYPYFASTNANTPRHFFHFLLSTEEGLTYFHRKSQILDQIIAQVFQVVHRLNLVTNATVPKSESVHDDVSTTLIDAGHAFVDETLGTIDLDYDADLDHSTFTHSINTLKQNLWLLGEIISSKYGIGMLDPINDGGEVIDVIFKLFYESPIWLIRGAAYFQLGRLAATPEGAEILDELNWVVLDYDNSGPLALSYPQNIDEDVFNIKPFNPYRDIKYYTLFSGDGAAYEFLDLEQDDEELVVESYEVLNDRILNYIGHLTVLRKVSLLSRIQRKALRELNKIKQTTPQAFDNVNLFLKVIKVVDKGNYELKTKYLIFDLFKETKVLEKLTRKSRKGSFAK